MVVHKTYQVNSFYDHCDYSYSIYGHKIVINNRDVCIDIGDEFTFSYDDISSHNHRELTATVYDVSRGINSTSYYTTISGPPPCSNGLVGIPFRDGTFLADNVTNSYLGLNIYKTEFYLGYYPENGRMYYGESTHPGSDFYLSCDVAIDCQFEPVLYYTMPDNSNLGIYTYGEIKVAGELNHTLGSSSYTLNHNGSQILTGTLTPEIGTVWGNYICWNGDTTGGAIYGTFKTYDNYPSSVSITLSNVCMRNIHGEIMDNNTIPAQAWHFKLESAP